MAVISGFFSFGSSPTLAADGVDLRVIISESTSQPLLNTRISYTVTVTNQGSETASGVLLTNSVPNGATVQSVSVSTGTVDISGNPLIWNIGSITAGASATMHLEVVPQLLGPTSCVVGVGGNEPDLNPADNTAVSQLDTAFGALPEIVSGPLAQSVLPGMPLRLEVDAISALPLRYQWRLNGVNIPGATNSTLLVPAFQPAQAGSYSVLAINDLGVTSSDAAEVTPILSLGVPFEDHFANRKTITGVSVLGVSQNLDATAEQDEPLHGGKVVGRTKWITWQSLLGGIATVQTVGSTFDTVLAVYSGDSLATLTPVADDDDSGGFLTSAVKFNVVAGQKYHIAVGGHNGASGVIVFNLGFEATGQRLPVITSHPAGRTVAPGTGVQLSVQATGTSLAYQWLRNGVAVPGANGSVLSLPSVGMNEVGVYAVRVTAAGRSVMSKTASLQLFIPGPGESFHEVRAEDKLADLLPAIFGLVPPFADSQNAQSSASPTARKTNSKSTKPSGRPPPSGGVGTMGTARGYTGTHVFSTHGSTSQPGEPNHCESPGGASQWVAYEAPEDGVLDLDTDGSDFDTVLGVYTGSGGSFESLHPVACDDNSGANGSTSRVVFDVQGGTTYYVAVDGVNGESGTVVLNYDLMLAPRVTSRPAGQIVAHGATVELTATVTGRPAPAVQWHLNGQPISGATNSLLVVDPFTPDHEGAYVLKAINPAGHASSSPASLLIDVPLKLASVKLDPSRQAKFRLVGQHSTTFLIQASTNLTDWTTIDTNYSDSGVLSYLDTRSTNYSLRFYRAVPANP